MKRFSGIELGNGFYGVEQDIDGDFFWTQPQFALARQLPFGYLYLKLCYMGTKGTLSFGMGSTRKGWTEVALHSGWQEFVVELPGAGNAGDQLEFQVNPSVTVPTDSREFGICVRSIQGVVSVEEYRRIVNRLDNEKTNEAEYQRGVTVLTTTPPKIRIDMETRCNMLPRCIYCAWDYTKGLEQENTTRIPFTPAFFDELGVYYENALEVVNCGHGEPLMSRDFKAVVERLDRDGKHFEFTTNGLLMDDVFQTLVLGKDIYIYVSIDAATAASYARYRNDQFDLLIGNIRRLCREKEAHVGGFPKVIMAFILMRSNLEEVEEFLALSHDLGVDAIVFKSLVKYDHTNGETQFRAGFEFNYANERLHRDELKVAKDAIVTANQKWGTKLFFLLDAAEAGGSCDELWRSLYVLERGICCFGRGPALIEGGVAILSRREQIDRALNSSIFQSLRATIAQDRIPSYCSELDCPLIPEHALRFGSFR